MTAGHASTLPYGAAPCQVRLFSAIACRRENMFFESGCTEATTNRPARRRKKVGKVRRGDLALLRG